MTHYHLGKHGLIQRAPGDCKSGGRGRMSMEDGHHSRANTVEKEMHRQFGGKLAVAGELPAMQIGDDQVSGSEHSFIHAGRSRENTAVIQPHRNVSFAGDDVSALVHPSSGNTNLATVLLFTFRVA